MQVLTGFAVYFLFWWFALFLVLPFRSKTQEEDQNIVNGSVKSAPAQFRGLRLFLTTSLVAGVMFAIWFVVTQVFGLSADSLPQIVPDF